MSVARGGRAFLGAVLLSCGHLCLAATLVSGGTLITMGEGEDEPFRGYLLIEDGFIVETGRGDYRGPAVEAVIDAAGKLVMPGFVSGHSHLWQSPFRGIAADGELWPWVEAFIFRYGKHLEPGDFYSFTLHGALDQLVHGITTTFNHSQRLDAPEDEYLESLRASLDSGQRVVFAYLADRSQPPAQVRARIEALVQRSREDAASGRLLAFAMNVPVVNADPARFRFELELAREFGLHVQLHYLEQYSHRFQERKLWPLLLGAGAVAEDVSFAHFIHPAPAMVGTAGERRSAMIWNPLSNGRLASGLPDIPGYIEAGIRVGMGLDSPASADTSDPFENMRMGMYALRMQHRSASVMLPLEVLRLHTAGTAAVLGIAGQVGSLVPEKRADFLIIDPQSPPLGALFDPLATLVLSASAANIEAVYVGGTQVVERGRPRSHDLASVQREAARRVQRLRAGAEAGR